MNKMPLFFVLILALILIFYEEIKLSHSQRLKKRIAYAVPAKIIKITLII